MLQLLYDLIFSLQLNETAGRLLYKEYRDRQGQKSKAAVAAELVQIWGLNFGCHLQSSAGTSDPKTTAELGQQLAILINSDQLNQALSTTLPELCSQAGDLAVQRYSTTLLNELDGMLDATNRSALLLLTLLPPLFRRAEGDMAWYQADSLSQAFTMLPAGGAFSQLQLLEAVQSQAATRAIEFDSQLAWRHLLTTYPQDDFVGASCLLAGHIDLLENEAVSWSLRALVARDFPSTSDMTDSLTLACWGAVLVERNIVGDALASSWSDQALQALKELFQSTTEPAILHLRSDLRQSRSDVSGALRAGGYVLAAGALDLHCRDLSAGFRTLNAAVSLLFS